MTKLYRVEFKFYSGYSEPTTSGFREVVLVVAADSQFTALSHAWAELQCLSLPEPKSFAAQEVGSK
jgi:hypothetical protein